MKRQFRTGSKLGEAHIAPHKENHKDKILAALGKLRVGGTHEEIAEAAGMRPDQVWKRLSELYHDSKIFDTGLLRRLKSGVHGTVWQLTEIPQNPPPQTVDDIIHNAIKPSSNQINLF